MRMRICLLLPSFLPEIGGLEVAADKLALQLESLGHKVVILAQRPRKAFRAIERPYPIIHYPRPRSRWYPCSSRFPLSLGWALERVHRKFGFHIVHAFGVYLPGYVAVSWGRRRGIPVLVSCHGSDISEKGPHLKRRVSRRRIVWTLRHADAVSAVCKNLARQASILAGESITVQPIYNGVEIADADQCTKAVPAPLAQLENRAFILTLGRLHPLKGLDLLFEAIKLLRARNSPPPILVVAGEGTMANKSRLLRQVEASALSSHVRFVGFVSGSTKNWLLANCKFLVQPSRSEGLPTSVLEAMSYGKAVLATSVGGLSELITSGQNGLLVEPDSPNALAIGLKAMLAADLSSYGQNALKAAQKYSCQNMAQQYPELYQSLVDGQRQGLLEHR